MRTFPVRCSVTSTRPSGRNAKLVGSESESSTTDSSTNPLGSIGGPSAEARSGPPSRTVARPSRASGHREWLGSAATDPGWTVAHAGDVSSLSMAGSSTIDRLDLPPGSAAGWYRAMGEVTQVAACDLEILVID